MSRKMFALGRLKSGVMNKTEAEYSRRLEQMQSSGEVAYFAFEAVTLKLAENTRLTPDFVVMGANGELQMHDVKGFMMDDAWVKLKVAAKQFPFRFFVARKKTKKDGGGWSVEEVPA